MLESPSSASSSTSSRPGPPPTRRSFPPRPASTCAVCSQLGRPAGRFAVSATSRPQRPACRAEHPHGFSSQPIRSGPLRGRGSRRLGSGSLHRLGRLARRRGQRPACSVHADVVRRTCGDGGASGHRRAFRRARSARVPPRGARTENRGTTTGTGYCRPATAGHWPPSPETSRLPPGSSRIEWLGRSRPSPTPT